MKWIFLSLLLGNIVYFAWQQQVVEVPVKKAASQTVNTELASLTLLSELDSAPQVVPKIAPEPLEPVCETLGPIVDDLEVRHVLARLTALSLHGERREIILPGDSEYMVYHPSLASRKLAVRKLQEFKARKVDSYIITKGERKNALSLGWFTKRDLAYRLQKNLKRKKIAANILVVESETRELWVDVRLAGDFVLEDRTRERIQAELKGVAWQKVVCGVQPSISAG